MSNSQRSTSDPAFVVDSLPLHLPPEQLKARLAGLIRASAKQGAAAVAETVVRHFQALSLHPQLAAELDERAAYCRGARHWRGLAAIGAGSASSAGQGVGHVSQGAGRIPAGAL
ncbi:MAG: hypothetical protein ACLFNA_10880 [Halochromatium sp.]|uniref:hypothetical protein n=1 Tax=Halochromatium sp. TaxID=2049430 RepID=UPI0039789DB6